MFPCSQESQSVLRILDSFICVIGHNDVRLLEYLIKKQVVISQFFYVAVMCFPKFRTNTS